VRSFRFQWPADLLTSWGIEMENLVLGWYIRAYTGKINGLSGVFGFYSPAYLPRHQAQKKAGAARPAGQRLIETSSPFDTVPPLRT